MNDGLLTDDEFLDAYDGAENISSDYSGMAGIAAAQRTKDLRAVAEWLKGECNSPDSLSIPKELHHKTFHLRLQCPRCIQELLMASITGKMPGEEWDAVHTTRETPRTISPD